MAATWTTPKTWSASELATAALFNTHFRDNITWLKTPLESGNITFAADFTTTSTSYVDITGVTTTLTTNGGGLDVFFTCSWNGTSGAIQVLVDGVASGVMGATTGANPVGVTLYRHLTGISAGSHTIKLQAKVGSGTLTIKGTTAATGDPYYYVREAGI